MTTNTFSPSDFYVATTGNDRWSGKLAAPNAAGTDGPFATITRARDAVRGLKQSGELAGPLTVWLRGGNYLISESIEFTPADSAPATYAAYPGETPIIDGGIRITDWHEIPWAETGIWVANLPANTQQFRSLFVNGERRSRPRLPKIPAGADGRNSFYRMESVANVDFARSSGTSDLFNGHDRFVADPEHFDQWRNLQDVEVVVAHYWIEERMPVASYDPKTREVISTRHSMFALKDDFVARYAKYYVDNVYEALSEPGEWYLDRIDSKLYYIPMPGEKPETTVVIAPRIKQFIKLTGQPDANCYVEFIHFDGLTFENTDWDELEVMVEPDTGMPTNHKYAASPQAAAHVPGAITLTGARYCSIENCTIRHTGFYAIDLADGCTGNRIIGNELFDMGGGGIKLNGADVHGPAAQQTGNNRITDNHIHTGGRVYHSAIGVVMRHSFGNVVSHNHIHDFYYSAISSGWVWGYRDSISHNNHIEKNHLHDLGHAWLSDMGGVYMLGVQPGTVIRGNVIHDVERANYGGWGIYTDEGSSHILIENNICWNTNSQTFHQHYGHENMLRNNIFAFGAEGNLAISRVDDVSSVTLERNIIVLNGQPALVGGYGNNYNTRCLISDLNLFWDVAGNPVTFLKGGVGNPNVKKVSLAEWQKDGYDMHSLVADPGFKDLTQFDFTLSEDSPALALGFRPIDISDVGPRPKGQRD